ncbi:MAG: hypothetical protein IPL08_13970 [Saprospiraceae bacterium]|nr:hypothetical protein [Saprospiraceae bacterium]
MKVEQVVIITINMFSLLGATVATTGCSPQYLLETHCYLWAEIGAIDQGPEVDISNGEF